MKIINIYLRRHCLFKASPKCPGLHLSQLKPDVSKRHCKHSPDLGLQLPGLDISILLLQSQGWHLPPGTSGLP